MMDEKIKIQSDGPDFSEKKEAMKNYSENEESGQKEPPESASGPVRILPFSKKTEGPKVNYDFIQPPPSNLQEIGSISQSPPPPQPKNPKKRKALLVLGVAAALLLAASGSALGYFFFFPPPEKTVAQSLAKMFAVKTLSYGGVFEFSENSGSQKSESPSKLSFEGSFDRTSAEDKKGLFSAKINVKENGLSPEGFSAELEGRSRGKVFYFRLNSLSSADSLPFEIEQYKNKWIKVDPESMKKKLRSEIPDSENYMDSFLDENQNNSLSDEQASKINEAFAKSGAIEVTKKLPSENIDGTSTLHYQFEIDKEKLKLFMDEAEKIRGNDENKTSSTDYFDEFSAFLEEKSASSRQEIWIGRWDKLPRKIQFKFSEGKTSASLSLTFSKFDVPFGVTEPESSVPVEDIIFGSLNQAKAKATVTSFRSTVVSANPAAMYCADESQIIGGNSGSPICSSKENLAFDDSWPDAPSGVCSKALKYVAFDAAPADGIFSYAASCQSPVNDETSSVVCNQNGCVTSDKSKQQADSDSDNFPDELENTFGTNSNNPDSDADGYKDGDELLKGYNPLIKGQ